MSLLFKKHKVVYHGVTDSALVALRWVFVFRSNSGAIDAGMRRGAVVIIFSLACAVGRSRPKNSSNETC